MNRFTIKDIENLTGIKSHTLRIWEQRYGIPSPKRTSTNIRYYDDEDLKLLLNVSMLNKQGHKISHLTCLPKTELENLVLSYSIKGDDTKLQIDCLMSAMFNLDEGAFERILSSHLMRHGIEKTMVELFFPFLKRIGILWQTGQVNPAFEHFISNLIRQKVIVAIDSQSSARKKEGKSFILFLPESEMHELGLLFANYVIRARGHHTIYLGQNLPYTDMDTIIARHTSDYIFSVITSVPLKSTVQTFVNNIAARYKNQTILLTGIQITSAPKLTIPKNVRFFHDMNDLISFADKA